ncbi:hypothetical protein [Plantactinospora sp. B5E13]|uniref:hypothetical protein n=1 Tax=unclassified Plantactinospora TaxID=2631981 RepID=UPI00325CDC25
MIGEALLALSLVGALVGFLLLAVRWPIGGDLQTPISIVIWAGRGICVAAAFMVLGQILSRKR